MTEQGTARDGEDGNSLPGSRRGAEALARAGGRGEIPGFGMLREIVGAFFLDCWGQSFPLECSLQEIRIIPSSPRICLS